MPNLKVGKITHYYDKIGVAVVEVIGNLHAGDAVEFEKSGFSQPAESMQVEHEQVSSAKKGDVVGLKVNKPVKVGEAIFKKT